MSKTEQPKESEETEVTESAGPPRRGTVLPPMDLKGDPIEETPEMIDWIVTSAKTAGGMRRRTSCSNYDPVAGCYKENCYCYCYCY